MGDGAPSPKLPAKQQFRLTIKLCDGLDATSFSVDEFVYVVFWGRHGSPRHSAVKAGPNPGWIIRRHCDNVAAMNHHLLKAGPGCALFLWAMMLTGIFSSLSLPAAETNMVSKVATNAVPSVVHVALVFDDGPFPDHAPKLVELFNYEHIHVTFSLVASRAQTNAATVLAILASGEEVANHSYAHRHPKELSDAELEQEIVEAQKILAKKCDGDGPHWYWPPYVEIDDRVRAMSKKAGIEVYPIKSLVVSGDYDRSVNAVEIKRRATTGVTDGSVILFHEWRDETLTQLPAIIAELRRQGCVFETFSQLAAYNQAQKPAQ